MDLRERRIAPHPDRRTAWGWTADARSLTEPTARVLLAVNALTPDDAATRREAVGLLRARQCADGGWNFGNASVYDVDLRGYAQTTAMGLIALQQGHARAVFANAIHAATVQLDNAFIAPADVEDVGKSAVLLLQCERLVGEY